MSEKREFTELKPTPVLAPVGLKFVVERGWYCNPMNVMRTDGGVTRTETEYERVVTSVQDIQVATHFGRIVSVPQDGRGPEPVASAPVTAPVTPSGGVSGPVVTDVGTGKDAGAAN